jgi:Protein of unknown function (DUF2934)
MAGAAVKRNQEEAPLHATAAEPTHEQIEALAYTLWQRRGCPRGSPEVDWLKAERTLRPSAYTDSGIGATEEEVNMRGTVPQRIDSHGSKVEDIAGTGKQDAPGG